MVRTVAGEQPDEQEDGGGGWTGQTTREYGPGDDGPIDFDVSNADERRPNRVELVEVERVWDRPEPPSIATRLQRWVLGKDAAGQYRQVDDNGVPWHYAVADRAIRAALRLVLGPLWLVESKRADGSVTVTAWGSRRSARQEAARLLAAGTLASIRPQGSSKR